MLSTALVLRTTSVKRTEPPGSVREVGLAVLVTASEEGVSVMVTVALPVADTAWPSSSVPPAVTVSVSLAPAFPVTDTLKVQL